MKKLFFISILCLLSIYSSAQVKLLDLSLLPINESDDSITVLVQFKAQDISNISGIHLIFESQPNLADVFQTNAFVIHQNSDYFAILGNTQSLIRNYQLNYFCSLSKSQFNAYHHFKVVVRFLDNSSAFLETND